MNKTLPFAFLGLAAASQAIAERGSLDPEFAKVPFEQWLTGTGQTQMRWTAHVFPARLSNQQRLLARFEVQLDGVELAKRRGRGQMIVFIQVNDDEGLCYQDHGTISLDKLEEGVSGANVTYTQYAFVLPGEYQVSFVLFDTAADEHSILKNKLHVSPLKKDPLPQAWRDLPRVEFRRSEDPPDAWYQPMAQGRLHLPLETRRRVRMEVLVNLTPSERASGSIRAQSRALGSLVPALKAISQIRLGNGSLNVAMLDLSRQRVAFHQDQVQDLDWDRIKDALAETDPATIDVKSLHDRRHNARFFVTEVGRRIATGRDMVSPDSARPLRVLVVLSSSVSFESGEDLQPIRSEPAPDCRVFYMRFHGEHMRRYAGAPVRAPYGISPIGRRPHGSSLPEDTPPAEVIDQLEPTLKPLAPRLFDITTPEQFRKALATMLAEIASL